METELVHSSSAALAHSRGKAPELAPWRETELVRRFPRLKVLPWMPLAHVPTQVERCSQLDGFFGGSNVWIKRDDLISPVFGGNKVRRYEFIFADVLKSGRERVLTVGGTGSTQVVATCMFAQALGLKASAVLFDQPVTEFVPRALHTSVASGAELIHGRGYAATVFRVWRRLQGADRPRFIPPGASTPLANLGYVDAALEIGAQVERGEFPRPDFVVVPCGTGGTLAGLALGFGILGWPTVAVGVRITVAIACNRFGQRRTIQKTADLLAEMTGDPKLRTMAGSWMLEHGFVGAGYGYSTAEAIEGSAALSSYTGSVGEITYTGKAMAAVRALVRANPNKNILYVNTLSSRWPDVAPEPDRLQPSLARLVQGAELLRG